MIIRLYYYIVGGLKIKVDGNSPERFFNMCVYHRIQVWNLVSQDNAYVCYIRYNDYEEIKPFLRKTGCESTIMEQIGVPFILKKNKQRKVFWSGLLLSILTIVFLSQYIWNISIEGNSYYTSELLMEYLNEDGVYRGMAKENVDCAQIVSDIRKEYNQIIWVSAHIDGTNLRIEIKENEHLYEDVANEADNIGMDIVATEDGVIQSIVTRSGVPVVHIGDTVKKGDVLVSGRIPILNDSKEVIRYEYVNADADISLTYKYYYEETIDFLYKKKIYDSNRIFPYIKINHYIFWPVANPKGNSKYDYKISSYDLHPSQQLNFSLIVGTISYNYYKEIDEKYSKLEVQELLSKEFYVFCDDLEEKKVDIIENNVKIAIDDEFAIASGNLLLNARSNERKRTEVVDIEIEEEEALEE